MSNKKRPPLRGLHGREVPHFSLFPGRATRPGTQPTARGAFGWRLLVLLLLTSVPAAAQPPDPEAIAALQTAQPLVGSWRGVAQPQRGATAGSWIETATWEWDFGGPLPALAAQIEGGQQFGGLRLVAAEQPGHYRLEAKRADGAPLHFEGHRAPDQSWVFEDPQAPAGQPARITWRFVADGARWIMLLEARAPQSKRYYRLAEIGYTRKGAQFAAADGQPECVVTGGLGSITVEHDGKTYYVCCSGCREVFESDPQRVLEEYRARLAAKQAADSEPD